MAAIFGQFPTNFWFSDALHVTVIVRARDLQFSHNIHYTLCVQCHMSHVRCHLSGVTCQVSHVTCHVSCVMCHVLCVICNIFFLQSGSVGLLMRLCYQQGLSRLVSRLFFWLKTFWYTIFTISACSSLFWVIKKANWWEINLNVFWLVFKCHKWQICARAQAAPCAHF